MINFSIIIPNRNNVELLSRCLDSIPKRDDIQIIVVDDNSDKHLVDFDKYPGYDNPNVELVFSKEGKGAGYARNVGLKFAKGQWLVFCDSDDEIITDTFSKKLDEYLYSDAEIIFFDVLVIDYESKEVLSANNPYQNIIRSKKRNREELCRYKLRVPWGKMIKKTLIIENNIEFDETRVANDAVFSLKTGFFAKEVVIDTTPIYRWFTFRKDSITSNRDLDSVKIHIYCAIRINDFLFSKKLDKYRNNLFYYFPMLIRSGMAKWKAFCFLWKNESSKYRFFDLKEAMTDYYMKQN